MRRYCVSIAVVVLSIILTAYLPALSQASSLFTILGAILFSAWYGGLGLGLGLDQCYRLLLDGP